MTLESSELHSDWAAHVRGASALLQLRGSQQLNHERGVLLFMLTRSQIVSLAFIHLVVDSC